MRSILVSLAFISSIFFVGCGGGGGSSSENNNTYDLESWSRKTVDINVTGTSSQNTFTGLLSKTYLGEDIYNGITVDKNAYKSVIYDGNVVVAISERTSYLSGGFELYSIDSDNVSCYLVNSPQPLPSNAPIGYVSDMAQFECDDLSSSNSIVKVKASGSTNAKVVISMENYFNVVFVGSETDEYLVDPNMKLISFEAYVNYGNSISISMYSTSITQ